MAVESSYNNAVEKFRNEEYPMLHGLLPLAAFTMQADTNKVIRFNLS